MDRVSLDVFVPVLLRVVIAGMIDEACFEKDSSINSVCSNREGVRSDDSEILLSRISICVDIVHGEEGMSLGFAESFNLLEYNCL